MGGAGHQSFQTHAKYHYLEDMKSGTIKPGHCNANTKQKPFVMKSMLIVISGYGSSELYVCMCTSKLYIRG